MSLREKFSEIFYEDLALLREFSFLFPPLYQWRKAVWQAMVREIPLECREIVEVGCGVGSFAAYLKRRFRDKDILAIDTSEEAIKLARKRYREKSIKFEQMDFFHLKGKYDCVVSVHVFILFDPEESFRKLRELLKPGGTAIISFTQRTLFTELHRIFYRNFIGQDIIFWSPQYLNSLARSLGFMPLLKKLDWSEGSFIVKLKI